MVGGYSIEEFRAVPCHHFLFSAICFLAFAIGYLHTRETNLEGRFPYFALGAILGGIVRDFYRELSNLSKINK